MNTAIVQHPEYIGLMFLHAARWHLERALVGPYSKDRVRRLRKLLPYRVAVHDGPHVGVCNRFYIPMGETDFEPRGVDNTSLQYRLPQHKCNFSATAEKGVLYLFDDSCPPWKGRFQTEAYLASLDRLFDFSLDDLPGGQEVVS